MSLWPPVLESQGLSHLGESWVYHLSVNSPRTAGRYFPPRKGDAHCVLLPCPSSLFSFALVLRAAVLSVWGVSKEGGHCNLPLNDFAAFGIHCQILTKAVSLCAVMKFTFSLEMIERLEEREIGSDVSVDKSKVLPRYFSPHKVGKTHQVSS